MKPSEARPIWAELDIILVESIHLDIDTKVQTSQVTQHRRIVLALDAFPLPVPSEFAHMYAR